MIPILTYIVERIPTDKAKYRIEIIFNKGKLQIQDIQKKVQVTTYC